jgi:hypothetical protein
VLEQRLATAHDRIVAEVAAAESAEEVDAVVASLTAALDTLPLYADGHPLARRIGPCWTLEGAAVRLRGRDGGPLNPETLRVRATKHTLVGVQAADDRRWYCPPGSSTPTAVSCGSATTSSPCGSCCPTTPRPRGPTPRGWPPRCGRSTAAPPSRGSTSTASTTTWPTPPAGWRCGCPREPGPSGDAPPHPCPPRPAGRVAWNRSSAPRRGGHAPPAVVVLPPRPRLFDLPAPRGTCYWSDDPCGALIERHVDPHVLDPVIDVADLDRSRVWRSHVPAGWRAADLTARAAPPPRRCRPTRPTTGPAARGSGPTPWLRTAGTGWSAGHGSTPPRPAPWPCSATRTTPTTQPDPTPLPDGARPLTSAGGHGGPPSSAGSWPTHPTQPTSTRSAEHQRPSSMEEPPPGTSQWAAAGC